MARARRKPAERTDWVYTDDAYRPVLAVSLVPGVASAIGFPLTYSDNARRQANFGTPFNAPPAGAWGGWYSIPEGSKQRVYEVDGWLRVIANTWNAGQALDLGWRLMHSEMDPTDGSMLTTPNYSLWTNSGNDTPASNANAGFLKEGRFTQNNIAGTAVTTSGSWLLPVKWKSDRGTMLGNSRALYCYVESAAGSITVRVSPILRARMAVA